MFDRAAIKRFSDIVFDAGYSSPIRTPRGQDNHGRLRSVEERQHQEAAFGEARPRLRRETARRACCAGLLASAPVGIVPLRLSLQWADTGCPGCAPQWSTAEASRRGMGDDVPMDATIAASHSQGQGPQFWPPPRTASSR